MRLVIKSPRQYPFPGDEGINVANGLETAIALKYTELHHLGEPYEPCVTEANSSWYGFDGEYSVEVLYFFVFPLLQIFLASVIISESIYRIYSNRTLPPIEPLPPIDPHVKVV